MIIEFSSNKQWRGKPEARESSTGRTHFYYNNNYVDLGRQWVNLSMDVKKAFNLFAKGGCPNSAKLSSDVRNNSNFVSRQILMVDIDEGMTIEELLVNDYYKQYALGYYTTPSHTDNNHRFRIVFVAENNITNSEEYKKIIIELMKIFKCADPSCKDSSRIFYGSINSKHSYNGNILPNSEIKDLINKYDIQNAVTELKYIANQNREFKDLTQDQMNQIMDFLTGQPRIDYDTWLKLGWAMKSAGFTLNDFRQVSLTMKSSKVNSECERIWNNGDRTRSNVGALINVLKTLGFTLKVSTAERLKRKYSFLSE